MPHLVQTEDLVAEGVLTENQGAIIAERSRSLMLMMLVNMLLTGGIIAAALGFVFWLQDAASVAVTGVLFLVIGVIILLRNNEIFHMFGNAAALIGALMLGVGGALEALDKLNETTAGMVLLVCGAAVCVIGAVLYRVGPPAAWFAFGAISVFAAALHLVGAGLMAYDADSSAWVHLMFGYAAMLTFALGVCVNVRFVTALAIVPFAQLLDTGTGYFGALYVFYSPETTLSILQMTALILVFLALAPVLSMRYRRHTITLGVLALIVGNLCFLVGSLWGDYVGETLWGPQRADFAGWSEWNDALESWQQAAFYIGEGTYSVIWAVLLIFTAAFSAQTNRRGAFNTAVVFGAIHAYTQFFESFYDEPLAYVIGGLAVIPLAWGIWRLNLWFSANTMQSIEPKERGLA